jgi:hypothetical protein
MNPGVRLGPPAPGTLKVALRLILVVAAVGLVAQAIGGTTASLVVGLSAGSAMTFGTFLPTRPALALTLVLGGATALGAAVSGQPLLSGAAVALMVLVTAPASAYSAGILMLAPLLTMLFAVTDRGWPWWQAGLWGVIGGLVGLAVAALMRFGRQAPRPLPWTLAWRHAIVLAVSAGASVVAAEELALDHGYWVAVTLLVALRPVPDERMAYAIQRIWGTLAGAAIALITVWLLPSDWLMPAAFAYLLALAAYAMSGNYFMQTMFLTPMLMLFLSAGADAQATVELTLGRVFYTIIGVVLAALLTWALAVWDRRSGEAPDQNPSGPDSSPADAQP